MKKRIISIMLALCMMLALVPQAVFAAVTAYNLMIGDAYFTSIKKTLTVGGGTATFDPDNSKLTLNNITLSYGTASTAAIESGIENLNIELIGTNTINISNDSMVGIYLHDCSTATITGTAGSKLIINSSGKSNIGIIAENGISLTMTNANLTVNDNTTDAASKGYMVGIKAKGDLNMSGGSYTATGVQRGIQMYTDCVANLSGVSFNITCAPRQSFSGTNQNEMSIGLYLAPLTSKQNVIANCSGSICAHYPLYVDGTTKLNNSNNLTLTSDNYDAGYVSADLTVSGGTLNLTSTGSSSNGFYVLDSSKLVFDGSPKVTINAGYVAIFLSGDSASAKINSGTLNTTAKGGVILSKPGNTFTLVNGTLNMTPKADETQAVGIQNYGTVSIEGGSLKTTAGMYSAIQNAGEKSISISGGTHTLSTSNGTSTHGYIDTSKGTLNISGAADVTFDGWGDGVDVLGALNLSGGKLTVRNAYDGIYTTGTLNLNGGTLNISGTRLGVLVGDGGLVKFAGTNATLVGGTAGWGKTSGSGAYSITGGKVVLQGDSYAASTIYSSLAEGYVVYAGSGESSATLISSPSIATFTGNKYARIEAITSYTLTLVNVKGATSASYVAGADLSYTAADAPSGKHFAYWEMKVGDSEAVKVGTDPTYTGIMPTGDATLTAVYEYCSGGKATCQAKAKCSFCGKEYGILGAHNLTAEVVDQKYEITPATCESAGTYYKSCTLCGASSEHWNNATFTAPATGHTLNKVEAKSPTCTEDGNTEYYECSVCDRLFADATGSVETNANYVVDKATGHDYEWIVDKEATETENGSKHEECKICHDKKAAVDIPANGVATEAELKAAINAGETSIKLIGDFKLSSLLNLTDKQITIDLNGHTLTGDIKLSDNSAAPDTILTLIDSAPNGGGVLNGKITLTRGSGNVSHLYANGGTVTGMVSLPSYAGGIFCTSDTPTAFKGFVGNYGSIHGGIFYGGINTSCIKEKTVTFMNGSSSYAIEVVATGNNVVAPKSPVKAGYAFDGWYDGDTKYTFGSTLSANITLTAKFSDAITYNIACDLGGGTATNATSYTVESDAITLNNPTKVGYTFTGWSGTGLTGEDNMTVTIPKGSTGNRTYTAHYTAKGGYTVAFDTDGGSDVSSKTDVKWTDKVLDGITAPTKDGWRFIAWKCGDITVTADTVYGDLVTDDTTASVTLVAQWEDATVKYGDVNGDGKINLLDLIAMRKHLAKWNVEIDTAAADCNADGKVNLLDLILMRKYLARWNVVLGPQK